MDTEHFFAPPTTTAALTAYYQKYGKSRHQTDISLVHFRDQDHIEQWLNSWREHELARGQEALAEGLRPIIGFSFYTWNAAEFLELIRVLKADLPEALCVAGGPHVQQAQDYLDDDPIDLVILGEGEATFTQLLDATDHRDWPNIPGLSWPTARYNAPLQDHAALNWTITPRHWTSLSSPTRTASLCTKQFPMKPAAVARFAAPFANGARAPSAARCTNGPWTGSGGTGRKSPTPALGTCGWQTQILVRSNMICSKPS